MTSARRHRWEHLDDDSLLDLRFRDLRLRLEETSFPKLIDRLQDELERRELRFRPHFWLSTDWFTPDGVSGVALPFFLAHPRLRRLEDRQVCEVEGGTPHWCMKLLRHECGHALDNAFNLRRRRRRQKIFGRSGVQYQPHYTPRPYSRKYVHHLDTWYAQSHPDEDFAETFAVWLTPNSGWRRRYAGWPALQKLEYIDDLMQELAGQRPPNLNRARVEPLGQLSLTLREHYAQKRAHLGLDYPEYFARDLHRLFSDDDRHAGNATALSFMRGSRREIRRIVARWTGLYQYTIDQVLEEMIDELRQRRLRLRRSPEETKLELVSLLTVHTMNYISDEKHAIPR